jgi:acyl-CoA synthetase (AMP-forming)/AMP-acid ligase II
VSVNYAEQVRRHALQRPARPAVIDGELELSYADLDARATRLATALLAAGVRRGDRVALLMDNTHRPVEVMIACARAGFVHVPLDFRLTADDVRAILGDCEPAAVIVDEPYRQVADAVRPDLPGVWVCGAAEYDGLLASGSSDAPRADVDDTDVFSIIYTSGTTGRAKGVTTTHLQTLDNAMAVIAATRIDGSSRAIVSYPHNSAGTVHHVWGPILIMGGALVMTDVRAFRADRYFALVEKHQVTHCQLVPTMLFRLLDHPDRDRYDLSSIRTVGYASAPIPPDRVREALDAFGPKLLQMYGMTETTSLATILAPADHVRAAEGDEHLFASCGRAAPGVEIRLVGDDGGPVPVGEVGEIVMRGRWLTTGYWNDPERTAETVRDGWLYSGDLGRMDDEEYLYVVDRKKDLLVTGGAKVASTEVEAVLYAHPAVLEAAAIGLPDREWGERIHAVVAVRPDHAVTPEELIVFCRERLAHFKCPKSAEVLAELPKTSTGKLAKGALRAREY